MEGATVAITGASQPLGRAIAREFADGGAGLVLGGADDDALGALVDELDGEVSATGLRTDVRDEYDVERLLETAAREGDGGIDAVVPAATVRHGEPGATPLSAESYSVFDDTLRANARGVFATIREAVPHLATDARVAVPVGGIAREEDATRGAFAVSRAAATAVALGFGAELAATVTCLDTGAVGGEGTDPATVAPMVRWAVAEADREAVDGEIVDRETWRAATA